MSDETMSKRQMEMMLLEQYYEEWKFRQQSLWKRMPQFFVVIFLLSTWPVSAGFFEKRPVLMPVSAWIFPLAGLVLSVLFLLYCWAEAKRIKAIDVRRQAIIDAHFAVSYRKRGLPPLFDKEPKWLQKALNEPMALWLPVALTLLNVLVAAAMLILSISGKL